MTRVTRRIYRSRFLQKCWTWTGFSQGGGGIERRKKSDWLLSPSNAARLTARTMPWNGGCVDTIPTSILLVQSTTAFVEDLK